jgi:hypothetical protein
MFHWICPECGQEIAPGVKECPVCEPQATPASVASSTPAADVAPMPVASAPAPFVERRKAKPTPPEPQIVSQPDVVLQPEVVLKTEVIRQPEIVERPEPRIAAETPPEPETFSDRLADLAERLHERIPDTGQRIVPIEASPRQHCERTPVIIDVTPAQPLLAPPPAVLLLAEPQPPSVAAGIPATEVFHPRAAVSPERTQTPRGAEPSSPGPVQLPDRPSRVAAPGLAPLQDYFKAADRQMRPAEYSVRAFISATEPRVTLPGPALPRELMSLQAAGLVPIGGTGRNASSQNLYGWRGRVAVLAILLTAGVGYWVMPGASNSTPAKPAQEPAPELPMSSAKPDNSNSLARFIEVSGVRFMEVNKKPQIHYLVVNHSSAPLGSVMVYVTLRSLSAKPGQAPLARLTFRSPDLAAFEAKEMFSSIERASAPLDLPDWQDLRADVEVQ